MVKKKVTGSRSLEKDLVQRCTVQTQPGELIQDINYLYNNSLLWCERSRDNEILFSTVDHTFRKNKTRKNSNRTLDNCLKSHSNKSRWVLF